MLVGSGFDTILRSGLMKTEIETKLSWSEKVAMMAVMVKEMEMKYSPNSNTATKYNKTN